MQAPATLGVVFAAKCRVHGAVDRPVDRVAQDGALTGGISVTGDQDPGLTWKAFHRMLREGEIKNRDSANVEEAVEYLCFVAYVYDDLSGRIRPLRARQLAARDGAVLDDVAVLSLAAHCLAGECDRIRGSERCGCVPVPHADCAGDLVKGPGLKAHVVVAIASFHVVIVRTAIESHVASRRYLRALGVVSNLIGAQDVIAKIDLGLAV